MVAAVAATGGRWTSGDLHLIDGGGNDAADLVGAYLGAASGAAGLAAYQTFLGQQLDAATRTSLLSQSNGAAVAAGAYMQALANTFYTQVSAQTIEKGATRVLLINMPDITLTPRFQALLAGVGAQQGAAASAALRGVIQQWIQTFNAQLRTRAGTDARVAIVDFYAEFTDQVANPAKYGLTNATRASCPVVGTDSSGLPAYDFASCTDTALNAAPPTGLAANWWQTWLFSDGFHPTPRGHQLFADAIVKVMDAKGWK
jgi:phospholipase/lecithinase/hemolysin